MLDLQQDADCLWSQEAIEAGVKQLAIGLEAELADKNPLFLVMMNGAMFFASDLLGHLHFPLQIDSMHLSRYSEEGRAGELRFIALPKQALAKRHVVLIDDLLDHGNTLLAAHAHCLEQQAAKVSSVVLLRKNLAVEQSFKVDHWVFDCPDRYVFGYGMDYRNYYRNLQAIYAIK